MAIFKFERSPFNLFPYVIIKTKQGFINVLSHFWQLAAQKTDLWLFWAKMR